MIVTTSGGFKIRGTVYPFFTIAQRNKCYRKAFETFKKHPAGPFLCNVMAAMLRDDYGFPPLIDYCNNTSEVVKAFFPELAEHLPTAEEGWPVNKWGDNKREAALTYAIENSNHI